LAARIAVAIAVAIASAAICWVKIHGVGYATDFAIFWQAGRAILDGQNPYQVVLPGGRFDFDSGFLYPLPAAVATAPLGALPIFAASLLFAALTAGGLAFAMTHDGWWRLPALMSFPMLWAVSAGQWAPIVAAAALSPAFAWLAACKPTLGAAAFLARPSWRFLFIGGAFAALAFLFDRRWPAEWLETTRTLAGPAPYQIPLLVPGGILLLLAALRWRTMEGRLLLGMALVPQTMLVYDQVAIGLIARTRLESIVWGLWSYAVILLGIALAPKGLDKAASVGFMGYVIVWGYYLPALVVVLRRPNEGPAPSWVERHAARWPAWLRGTVA